MRAASLPLALSLVALSGLVAFAASPPPRAAAPHPRPAPPSATLPLGGTDGRPLIVEAVAAPKHVSFVGQISSIRSGPTQAFASIAKIEHRAPDETRRTYVAPRALYGQFVISRGAMSWDVQPDRKRVVVSENKAAVDPVAVVDDIALLDGNYRAVRSASDDVANRHVDVVDLVSRYTGERAMRLWIDVDTHVVLAKEAYHNDGSLAWRTRFDDIRYTDDIPAEVFTSTAPAGYTTVQGRSYGQPQAVPGTLPSAGFTPITPKYLPDGFTLTSGSVSSAGDVRNLHLIYSDGIRVVSLFENATNRAIDFSGLQAESITFEKHPAQYARDGQTTLLAWRERNLAFALVGDLELKELVQIAISVVP